MILSIQPSLLCGEIAVPGSKSHTIRAIAAALMAEGESTLHAPLVSADTLSTLRAAERLGAVVSVQKDTWHITGCNGMLHTPETPLDMGNSGTGLRILSGLAATGNGKIVFDGDASLRTRPMAPLLAALRELGVTVHASGEKGCCPVEIQGPILHGGCHVDAVSSQFLTALLFAAPFARNGVAIDVGVLNEVPYVEITLDWLNRLGIVFFASQDRKHFHIPAPQRITGFTATIPADFSTAAFPLGAGVLVGKGEGITICNLDFHDAQGDKAIFDMLKKMGASMQIADRESVKIDARQKLHGAELDLNATPDALPILAVIAAALPGEETRLLNVPQARIKETDRISCMTRELRKMGAEVEELPDGMIIHGTKLHGAALESYQDHRIVMALAVAALAADSPSTIRDAESCEVTYQDFITDFQKLGAAFSLSAQK